ncbi:MAG: ABC transporter ATP-binding protein [Candidatus Omnitrophota bacterium]
MIELNNIHKQIGGKRVLDGISFSIPSQKIVSLCGPNGAGKTTLIRIILQLIAPDQGTVNYAIPREQVSFLFHNSSLFDDLTLKENIDFFLSVKGIALDKAYLDQCLKLLSLENEFKKRITTFSRGMIQKADLLRALMEKPSVLILDEPTSHLDPIGKVEIRKILRELVRQTRIAIFLTSHLLAEVEKVTDQVIIMDKGKIKLETDIRSLIAENSDLESKYIEIITGKIEPQ